MPRRRQDWRNPLLGELEEPASVLECGRRPAGRCPPGSSPRSFTAENDSGLSPSNAEMIVLGAKIR